jgi:PAS domain S-box-containing protein
MLEFDKPERVDEEIILDSKRIIMSKTDKEGIFEFANDYFMELSGYEEYELMGKPESVVQHPDMPKVIINMMREKILNKENFHAIVKSIAKDGKFYWSITDFSFKFDDNNDISAIYCRKKTANRDAITFFSKVYKTLVGIESKNGADASEKYLEGFLEDRQLTFSELVKTYHNEFPETAPTTSKQASMSNLEIFVPKPSEEPTTPKPKVVNPIIPEVKTESPITTNIQKTETPTPTIPPAQSDIKDRMLKVQELQEQVQKTIDESSGNSEKKGFFQRMFGKTEEEIEAEKNRKKK